MFYLGAWNAITVTLLTSSRGLSHVSKLNKFVAAGGWKLIEKVPMRGGGGGGLLVDLITVYVYLHTQNLIS